MDGFLYREVELRVIEDERDSEKGHRGEGSEGRGRERDRKLDRKKDR